VEEAVKRFEYRSEIFHIGATHRLVAWLNTFGEQGWELVAANKEASGVRYVFKREKE
jgi:hypothetical protein